MQDKDLPRQSRRLGWKIYAFFISTTLILSYVYVVANDFQAFVVSDIAASATGLVGLFGYAYRRKILQAQLWTVWSIFLPVWDLTSNFVYEVSLASTVIATAVHVPEYVALWRYGRESSEIWGTSQPSD
jgi:hypothetical protein